MSNFNNLVIILHHAGENKVISKKKTPPKYEDMRLFNKRTNENEWLTKTTFMNLLEMMKEVLDFLPVFDKTTCNKHYYRTRVILPFMLRKDYVADHGLEIKHFIHYLMCWWKGPRACCHTGSLVMIQDQELWIVNQFLFE